MTHAELLARFVTEPFDKHTDRTCGNVYTCGNVAYSYGRHFPMLIDAGTVNGERTFVLNADR